MQQWLPVALESCLWQSRPDFEVIVVNDGSTDASGTIAERYAKLDSRIRVIHKTNAGLGAARQTGQDEARGTHITWLDADDFLSPDAVAVWLGLAEKDAVDMVCANAIAFSDRTFNTRRYFYHPAAHGLHFDSAPRYWKSKVVWRWIVSLEYIRKHAFTHPHFKLSQDVCFMYEALTHAKAFSQAEQSVYFFRQEHKSAHASLEVEVEHNLAHFRVVRDILLKADRPKVLVKYLNENYLRDVRKLAPRMVAQEAHWLERSMAMGFELFEGMKPEWFEASFLAPEVPEEPQMAALAKAFIAQDRALVRQMFEAWRDSPRQAPDKENTWHTLRHRLKALFRPMSRQTKRLLRQLETKAASREWRDTTH